MDLLPSYQEAVLSYTSDTPPSYTGIVIERAEIYNQLPVISEQVSNQSNFQARCNETCCADQSHLNSDTCITYYTYWKHLWYVFPCIGLHIILIFALLFYIISAT